MINLNDEDLAALSEDELDKLFDACSYLEEDKKTNPFFHFKPLKTQQKFLDSKAKIKALFGGNQFGKTTTGAFAAIKDCIENPNHHWWAGSETNDLSIKVQQFKINAMLPRDEVESSVIYSSTRGFRNGVVTFKNGSTISFKTFAQERERWQGGTLHGIWLDEEPGYDIFEECLPRLVAHNGQLMFTMTSLCGFTKIVEFLLHGDKSQGVEVFFGSTWENSTEFGGALDPEAIATLENRYDDPDERKARIHGIPSPKSGIVFKTFQDAYPTVISLDKCSNCNPQWPTVVSIDPHNQTPHCVLWLQVAPSGHVYIMKERAWLQSEKKMDRVPWITLDQLAGQIQWENYGLNIQEILIDKYGSGGHNAVTGTSIVDELFRKGLVCQGAGGSVTDKILITQRYFREKKLHIQADCWNLLWEIRRYVWQEHISSKTAERREEHQKPRKKDDHLIDCMMNALHYINSAGIVQQAKETMDSVRRNPNGLEKVNHEDLYRRQNEEYQPDLMSIYE